MNVVEKPKLNQCPSIFLARICTIKPPIHEGPQGVGLSDLKARLPEASPVVGCERKAGCIFEEVNISDVLRKRENLQEKALGARQFFRRSLAGAAVGGIVFAVITSQSALGNLPQFSSNASIIGLFTLHISLLPKILKFIDGAWKTIQFNHTIVAGFGSTAFLTSFIVPNPPDQKRQIVNGVIAVVCAIAALLSACQFESSITKNIRTAQLKSGQSS
ncbi:MAG: hypothetical protein AABW86_05535 [Candidatus Micrarchaeota archaeon]